MLKNVFGAVSSQLNSDFESTYAKIILFKLFGRNYDTIDEFIEKCQNLNFYGNSFFQADTKTRSFGKY